jgi:hypothetical protein
MATKRAADEADEIEINETQGAVVMAPEPAVDPEQQPFVLRTWNGLPQWRCRFCAWDTLKGEATALVHFINRHVGVV